MKCIDLKKRAEEQASAWRSTVVGKAAGVNVKVLRMDSSAYENEIHEFDEALLVLDGQMNLDINGEVIQVLAGEVFIVPAGLSHGVASGSYGTLVIVDR